MFPELSFMKDVSIETLELPAVYSVVPAGEGCKITESNFRSTGYTIASTTSNVLV